MRWRCTVSHSSCEWFGSVSSNCVWLSPARWPGTNCVSLKKSSRLFEWGNSLITFLVHSLHHFTPLLSEKKKKAKTKNQTYRRFQSLCALWQKVRPKEQSLAVQLFEHRHGGGIEWREVTHQLVVKSAIVTMADLELDLHLIWRGKINKNVNRWK